MTQTDQPNSNLEDRLLGMRVPPDDVDCLFHAITLTADDNGRVTFGRHTEWVGYEGEDRRTEMRQSRLVYADHAREWEFAGLPYLFVLSEADLLLFLLAGGNALVERSIAEGAFGDRLKPRPSYPDGQLGYVGRNLLKKTAFRRAPTPKLRMAVFKRDGHRCRICGRNPDNNVDLVLHVHHIRPWEIGGMTEISNLITLCHTCHSGLDPHHDPSLFKYIKQDDALSFWKSFDSGVTNYRRKGFFG